jgi:hypothetical protein
MLLSAQSLGAGLWFSYRRFSVYLEAITRARIRLGYFTQSRLPTREQWSVRQKNQLPRKECSPPTFLFLCSF